MSSAAAPSGATRVVPNPLVGQIPNGALWHKGTGRGSIRVLRSGRSPHQVQPHAAIQPTEDSCPGHQHSSLRTDTSCHLRCSAAQRWQRRSPTGAAGVPPPRPCRRGIGRGGGGSSQGGQGGGGRRSTCGAASLGPFARGTPTTHLPSSRTCPHLHWGFGFAWGFGTQKWPDTIFPTVNSFLPTVVTLVCGEGGPGGGGGGGLGTRPRYLTVCLWRRLLASGHCSF